jgi:hypothetical protein
MNRHLTRRLVVVVVLGLAPVGLACAGVSPDPCSSEDRKAVEQELILEPRGTTPDSVILKTPEARKDCHAHFTLSFAWADGARRQFENTTPPVDYKFRLDYLGSTFFAPPPRCAMAADGDGCWCTADLSVGAKTEVEPFVKYVIEAWTYERPSVVAGSVRVRLSIGYTPYQPPG